MSVSYRLPVDTKDKKTNKEKANEKKASWTDSEEVQTFSQSLGRWFLNLDIFFSLLAFIKRTLFPLSKIMTEGKHRAEEDYRNFGFFLEQYSDFQSRPLHA